MFLQFFWYHDIVVAVTVYVHVLLSHVFHVQLCSVCMCDTLTAATQAIDLKAATESGTSSDGC